MKRIIFKIIYSIFITSFFSSCNIDCKKIAEIDRQDNILIIVKKIPDSTDVVYFKIVGKTVKTGKDTIYDEENRWFCTYYPYISIGDTIIKHKGELTFNIHKKDTILSFPWECEGKIYK